MKQEVLPLGQALSVRVLQPLSLLQYLQVNAHDPDKLRSTIMIEAFMMNDNPQLLIYESINMSFILNIRANMYIDKNDSFFALLDIMENLTHDNSYDE